MADLIGNSGIDAKSLTQLRKVIARSKCKGMIHLGQAYLAKGMLGRAANTLRDLLLINRNIEEVLASSFSDQNLSYKTAS